MTENNCEEPDRTGWHRNHIVIALFAIGGPFLLIYFMIYLLLAKIVEITVRALAKGED